MAQRASSQGSAGRSSNVPDTSPTNRLVVPVDRHKELPTILCSRGLHLWWISVGLENRIGILADVARVVSDLGLNIGSSQSWVAADGRTGRWTCFAETRETLTAARIESALQRRPGVTDVAVESDHHGVLIAKGYPILSTIGSRLVAITASPFSAMLDEVRMTLGSGGAVLLYQQGKALGKVTWEGNFSTVGEAVVHEEAAYLLELYSTLGWGQLESVTIDEASKRAVVVVSDSFECASTSGGSSCCYFLRGHIAGFFETLWKVPIQAAETTCRGKGDPVCTFEMTREAAPP